MRGTERREIDTENQTEDMRGTEKGGVGQSNRDRKNVGERD